MKEKTKSKIFGKRYYAIYRRLRYIRFLKKKRKIRKKELKLEKKIEDQQFKQNLVQQKKLNRQLSRQKEKQLKQERKLEKKEIKQNLRTNIPVEQKERKQQTSAQREEDRLEQLEVKKRMRESSLLEKKEQINYKRRLKRAKKDRKRRIRKLRPYLLKRRHRERMIGIRSINIQTIKRWFAWSVGIAESKTSRSTFFKILLNSTALFILSYLVLFIIGQVITAWVALSFDYKLIIYYFKLYYNIRSDEWSGDAVKILYSIQPLVGLLFGFISLTIYNNKKNEPGNFKLFYLWGFVHGIVFFFGSLLMGTLLNQGFGWVISYLYYKDTGKMIFSIISIFALAIAGTSIARLFIFSGSSYFNFIDQDRKRIMIVAQTLLPAILGTVVISILKIPAEFYYISIEEVSYEIIKLSTILLLLIPMFFAFTSIHDTFFDEEPRKIRLGWVYILITCLIIAALYFGLQGGIQLSPASL